MNMERPVIGISTSFLFDLDQRFIGSEREYVNRDYIDCVTRAGGLAVILPKEKELLDAQMELIDGFILSGGYDVDPFFYGRMETHQCGMVRRDMDEYDLAAVPAAVRHQVPVLGICRGCQIINVSYGGTLVQDIPSERKGAGEHMQKARRQDPTHAIHVSEGTFLASCLPETAMVNSFHHQCIDDAGRGLVISAVSADGIIEGIEKADDRVYGVQFHPEMMGACGEKYSMKLFEEFIHLCQR
jgi:putative glutamine amidotransferase